jgi:hypothetical protein
MTGIMVSTFQALGVFLLAMLPGALYVWAFERQAGGWGLSLSDRLLRFIGTSAVFQALGAPITYVLYGTYVHSGRLARGAALPWWLWALVVAYVVVPTACGHIVGHGTRRRRSWALKITGPSPAPRAWDHLFGREALTGWIRLRMKEGGWIVGAYAQSDTGGLRSYAAGYPEDQDLFLIETAECDPDTGAFVVDERGAPRLRGISVLVRWDEVAYLEYIPA